MVDVVDLAEKLDEPGIRLVQRVAGVVVFQLKHTCSAGSDGVHHVSVVDVRARSRGARAAQPTVVPTVR
jgi:hypothetical protein